jgi:hypothetical protein
MSERRKSSDVRLEANMIFKNNINFARSVYPMDSMTMWSFGESMVEGCNETSLLYDKAVRSLERVGLILSDEQKWPALKSTVAELEETYDNFNTSSGEVVEIESNLLIGMLKAISEDRKIYLEKRGEVLASLNKELEKARIGKSEIDAIREDYMSNTEEIRRLSRKDPQFRN